MTLTLIFLSEKHFSFPIIEHIISKRIWFKEFIQDLNSVMSSGFMFFSLLKINQSQLQESFK